MFIVNYKLLLLCSVTVLSLRGEAAGAVCGQRSSISTIPRLPGKPGENGAPGESGPKGEVGADGRNGSDGASGPQGPVGLVGPRGISGMNGTDGKQGPVGPQGLIGPAGLNGRDGVNGRNGSDGIPGPPGTVPDAVIEQLKGDLLGEVRKLIACLNNPANSCKAIHEFDLTSPSGYYWINTTTGPVQVYCEMDTNNCGNITGGWMRAVYINMTNINNTCPQGLTYTAVGSTCVCASSHSTAGCTSVIFPTRGVPYIKVCGRVFAYQHGSDDGFYNYHGGNQRSLNDYYVDGLSVTYGSPRSHIWTFVAGLSKGNNYAYSNCPCALYPGPEAPPFVGENYFCESGISAGFTSGLWYLDDPLWDSQGCVSGSTCCNRGGPWFTTTLSQEVSDDIEVRWCFDQGASDEDIGVEQLEIYVY